MRKFGRAILSSAMVFLVAGSASAQRRISGRVTDKAGGEPLASATIALVGSLVGTATNQDGRFSLTVPTGAAPQVGEFVCPSHRE